MAQTVKNPHAMQEIQLQSLGWEDPLEKEMAAHSSILPGKFHGVDWYLMVTFTRLFTRNN